MGFNKSKAFDLHDDITYLNESLVSFDTLYLNYLFYQPLKIAVTYKA